MAMQPPPVQQPPSAKKGMSTCLVVGLVVVGVGVLMIGVFAALAISGVRKYLAAAKSAEAKSTVSAIARAATAAYEADTVVSGRPVHRLCASATPVPAKVPSGVKYQPSSAAGADFQFGSASAGWPCLKISITQPFYYQYGYVTGVGSGKSGATANGFEASARGDTNGDGVFSFFARGADVRNGMVVVSTEMYIENELE